MSNSGADTSTKPMPCRAAREWRRMWRVLRSVRSWPTSWLSFDDHAQQAIDAVGGPR